ncbi:hypothetical protein LAUMK191_00287 [Mycobacterium attenuatum]|uniref:hypothetical protein n=1 Tax=Mycobacterium attenuatum TaxID=2341086 RepID=UPI000F1C4640|nr:hypothetical protein [Mycobacterium attenuatum]VBA45161.1 hypothetical protein LAUMK191_00287 [Mycobacterium attenuatum]
MPASTGRATGAAECTRSARAHRGTTPNAERQIHRACGDVRTALLQALELLSVATAPRPGRDDVFRAYSDLGCVQRHVLLALHTTDLLDQMVGTQPEHRQPWSYYRGRIGMKLRSMGRREHQATTSDTAR